MPLKYSKFILGKKREAKLFMDKIIRDPDQLAPQPRSPEINDELYVKRKSNSSFDEVLDDNFRQLLKTSMDIDPLKASMN